MAVAELRAALFAYPDDMPVVVHEYLEQYTVDVTTVLAVDAFPQTLYADAPRRWCEWEPGDGREKRPVLCIETSETR